MIFNKKALKYYLELLWELTSKEIRVRYKRAILGFLWMFLNPLLQMVVIGLVFSVIFKFAIRDYYLFLLIGLLPWNYFSLSLVDATTSITTTRELIKKSRFPRSVIPLSILFSNGVHFLASLSIIIPILLLTNNLSMKSCILPFVVIWQIFFSLGLILITSGLHPRYRDVSFTVRALTMIWFYATPIIYPLSIIPRKLLPFYLINPMSDIVSLYRFALLKETYHYLSLNILFFQIFLTFFIFGLGICIFRKNSRFFSDWL